MIMQISLNSEISADGFEIKIENEFTHEHAYGYDASYDARFANDNEPFVSDIIFELMEKYKISPDNVRVVNGINEFKGSKNNADIDEFINDYCKEAYSRYRAHCQ